MNRIDKGNGNASDAAGRIAGRRAGRWLCGIAVLLAAGSGWTQDAGRDRDVFKGKLFPPNVILEQQDRLGIDKEQYTAIRAAVVEAQGDIAAHEWDLRTAYQNVLAELDKVPIDQERVLKLVGQALEAENAVKKRQVAMLIELRNLLSERQIEQLRESHAQAQR